MSFFSYSFTLSLSIVTIKNVVRLNEPRERFETIASLLKKRTHRKKTRKTFETDRPTIKSRITSVPLNNLTRYLKSDTERLRALADPGLPNQITDTVIHLAHRPLIKKWPAFFVKSL